MTATKTAETTGKFIHIAVNDLKPSKTNPRKHFDELALNELAESIKRQGVVQPILVRENGSGYEIVAGERRYRAAQVAGLTEVPAIVRELNDNDVLEIQVIENLQRMDLHALEEAQGYKQLLALRGYDAARIAERVGRSVKYVYDRIKLLDLIEPIQKDFRDNKITAGHAVLLARLSPADQKTVSSKNGSGGLWQSEGHVFDFVGKGDGMKLRTVRELQTHIAEHVRFVPERDADPMLFPETAELMKHAKQTQEPEEVIAITTSMHVQDSARTKEKIIMPISWQRADGKSGSKKCDLSRIGVIVVGDGQGQAFRVCTEKEKCKTHWLKWQKDRAKRRGFSGKSLDDMKDEDRKTAERAKAEEERKKTELERFNKARPSMLRALAEAIKKAPVSADGLLAKAVINECRGYGLSGIKVNDFLMPGTSAEDVLRYAAFLSMVSKALSYGSQEELPKLLKAFGISAQKLINEAVPLEEKPATLKAKK